MTEQTELDGFTGDSDSDDEIQTGPRKDVQALKKMPENAEPWATLSCPWCCAPEEDLTTELSEDDSVGCSNCEASIPVDAEWYLNGEKVIV